MDRIEPRIHDEIKDYKEKFYNFTLRQWIFGILILITTVPLYLVLTLQYQLEILHQNHEFQDYGIQSSYEYNLESKQLL